MKYIVTATPPTPNGDLHVGHLSGPYLAADIFSRARKLLGDEVIYVSGSDNHQTYVVTSAAKLNTTPEQLAEENHQNILSTLKKADIAIDYYGKPTPDYCDFVQTFFSQLDEKGLIKRKVYRFPVNPESGRLELEAYAQGFCPECYVETCGAICETCGHPNDPATLITSSSLNNETQEVSVAVLPLENYREEIEQYYQSHAKSMRPHVIRFVNEMLSRPLPDFPITYPADWGISAPLAGLDKQVYNVWAEMYPALLKFIDHTNDSLDDDFSMAKGSNNQLVQFLGYDNTFYFSIVHLALSFAAGNVNSPASIVTNEFFHLENQKFSTSRRHLIWARDLADRCGSDNLRLGLSLNNPEHQVANFTESEFNEVLTTQFHQPMKDIVDTLNGLSSTPVSFSEHDRALFEQFAARMERSFSKDTFSLREASHTLINILGFIRSLTQSSHPNTAQALLGLHYFAFYSNPIIPKLSQQIWNDLQPNTRLSKQAIKTPSMKSVPEMRCITSLQTLLVK